MAKTTSLKPTPTPAHHARTTAEDIDDIFSAPAASSSKPIASSSALKTTGPEEKKKKKKGEKRKAEADDLDVGGGSTGVPSKSIHDSTSSNKKKKKKEKNKLIPASSTKPASEPESDFESAQVETISDPSILKPSTKSSITSKAAGKGGSRKTSKLDEEEEMFRDSRGEGPRRKTEEGFAIFKEAELDIDPEAGGTDLCPFDCDCCF